MSIPLPYQPGASVKRTKHGFDTRRKIWAYVSENPGASINEISRSLGMNRSGVYKRIVSMIKTGVLVVDKGPDGSIKTRTLRAPVPLVTLRSK